MRHSFVGLTVNGYFVWKLRCSNCGVWVPGRVAKQLEGLPCR